MPSNGGRTRAALTSAADPIPTIDETRTGDSTAAQHGYLAQHSWKTGTSIARFRAHRIARLGFPPIA
jgi:hypothetical protein